MLISNTDIPRNMSLLLGVGGFRGFVCIDRLSTTDITESWSVRSENAIELGATGIIAVALELLIEHYEAGNLGESARIQLPAVTGAPYKEYSDPLIQDPLDLSYRDCARLLMKSDDPYLLSQVIGFLGDDRINRRLETIGLRDTQIFGGNSPDIGTTTARDAVQLLRHIWVRSEGRLKHPCSDLRRSMGTLRVGGLARLFPSSVKVSSVGCYSGIKMASELGVIEYSSGDSYALAISAESRSPDLNRQQALRAMTDVAAQAMAKVLQSDSESRSSGGQRSPIS